jgi:hypothetical protein
MIWLRSPKSWPLLSSLRHQTLWTFECWKPSLRAFNQISATHMLFYYGYGLILREPREACNKHVTSLSLERERERLVGYLLGYGTGTSTRGYVHDVWCCGVSWSHIAHSGYAHGITPLPNIDASQVVTIYVFAGGGSNFFVPFLSRSVDGHLCKLILCLAGWISHLTPTNMFWQRTDDLHGNTNLWA